MSGRDLSKMGTAKVTLKTDEHGHPVIEKCPVGDEITQRKCSEYILSINPPPHFDPFPSIVVPAPAV